MGRRSSPKAGVDQGVEEVVLRPVAMSTNLTNCIII